MRRVNVFAPDFGAVLDRDGYRRRAARLGDQLGAEQIGGTVYEIPAGEKNWPYHFHHGMEEWVVVLDGTPTLRSPEGERVLRRGDVVCFPVGPEGAHQLRGPGTVLLLSANGAPETLEYPDSDKVGTRPPGLLFRKGDAVDYWDGE
ncbi:MAG: cupin domain-containing protein [Actinobacteria bacterium]|nr:cupin domain-containing protein [Actinomycetota bacterium]MBV8395180.1 cupin domain-containing protein [Actinomycetota bacterium]MBV8599537.1 cupin domain-containing protein [Actinomycetota bacterium]